MTLNKKIIVIVGPTSSGKSELAVKLAKKLKGEVVSVDSRQIYRGMNIGTGKITKKEMSGVPHWGLDLASPKAEYSVAKFQKYARKAIENILKRNKIPILCGGTMHWMDAVVLGQVLPEVKPDPKLRALLSKLSTAKLFEKLKKLDPKRASSIDPHNPRRLIRALEIIISTGKPIPELNEKSPYNISWIGINPEKKTLQEKIKKRLITRLKNGMITEVKKLHDSGVSWKRLESFGLEYKYCALYLQGKLTKQKMEEKLFIEIYRYAKRQMTWWKRNPHIHWIKNYEEALKMPNQKL